MDRGKRLSTWITRYNVSLLKERGKGLSRSLLKEREGPFPFSAQRTGRSLLKERGNDLERKA